MQDADFDQALELVVLRDAAFRLYLETTPVPTWCKYFTDGSGRMLFLSRSYEDWYGVGPEDYVGKTDYDVWPREVADEFRQRDLRALEQGEVFDIEPTVRAGARSERCEIVKWAADRIIDGLHLVVVYGIARPIAD